MTNTETPSAAVPTAETEAMFTLSEKTVQITYDALKRSAKKIIDDSKGILDTVEAVSDVLNAIMGRSSVSESLRGLGLIALPIPLALKAIAAVASKYVEHRTGMSLHSWTDFVNSARTQFEEYLAQLRRVNDLSRGYDASSTAKTETQLQELAGIEELLQDTKVKTTLWRPVMDQVGQLSPVIDAMLASRKTSEQDAEAVGAEEGWINYMATKTEEVIKGVTRESQQVLDTLLAPISELKERTKQMSTQIGSLSGTIWELEDLIDLEIAQIQACLGKIPAQQVDILSKRVAASILVPRLKKQLTEARHSVATQRTFLEKLSQMHQQAKIKDKIYEILLAEYKGNLDAAMTLEKTLESEANTWRSKGGPILDAGMKRLEEQIENTMARQLVGQITSDTAQQRMAPLEREMSRYQDAKQVLATL